MVAIRLDYGASSSGRLPTTMKGNAKYGKKGSFSTPKRPLKAFLFGFLCINVTGGLMVLFLEKFNFISWGPAKNTLGKLDDAFENLEHSVIEDQIGMKLLSMEQYSSMHEAMNANKQELTTLQKWLTDKEKEVEVVTKEKDNIHSMVEDIKNERNDLKAKVATLQGEREGWRKEVKRITADRDKIQKELDDLKKQSEK